MNSGIGGVLQVRRDVPTGLLALAVLLLSCGGGERTSECQKHPRQIQRGLMPLAGIGPNCTTTWMLSPRKIDPLQPLAHPDRAQTF